MKSVTDQIGEMYAEKYDTYISVMVNKTGSIDDAEDVVQEAFYRALKFADKWKEERGTLVAWFNAILNNCLYDWSKQRVETEEIEDDDWETEELEDTFLIPDMVAHLLSLIDSVKNPEHRDILNMAYTQGFKGRDIADIMGCSHEKVRKIKYDFRQKVKEGL